MKLTVPSSLLRLCQVLTDAGHDTYIVGGAIRNALLGKSVQEYDIATSALPTVVQNLFPDSIATGALYGTITVRMKESGLPVTYEITTFRTESGYSDHRHPDIITFGKTIEQDLSRRDFTINAIAFNPISKRFVDAYGGIKDCRNRCLRAIRNPKERFEEDALRLFRLCRFVAQYNLQVEEDTLKALLTLGPTTPLPAIERIQSELMKLLLAPSCDEGLQLLLKSELLNRIIPKLNHEKAMSLKLSKEDPSVRIAILIGCGDDYHETIKGFRFSRKESQWIERLIEREFNPEKAALEAHHLALKGQMLMDMGYQGKAIGNIQHILLDAVIKEKIPNEKQALWDYLRTKLFTDHA